LIIMPDEFDFVVIGGGSAGYAAAAAAVQDGLTVAVVEDGAEVGGLCILRGCMPSKTLLESANRFRSMTRAEEFGLRAGDLAAVGSEIIARKRCLISEFAQYREKQLRDGRFEFIRGHGCFADPHTLDITLREGGERQVRGKTFLVATGSRLDFIDIPGLRDIDLLDSDRVLEHEEIPASIVVLGAGAISLEFAHYYNALGSEVTVIQRSEQVLSDMDEDVAEALTEALRARGVTFYFGTSVQRLSQSESGKQVDFACRGEAKSVTADAVLYALGRRPRTDALRLDETGVTCSKFLLAHATQQTEQPHIFAAGDVTGPHEIVHLAIMQGETAARNAARLLGKRPGPMEECDYRLKLMVIFSDPEVAVVGQSEKELKAAGVSYRVASHPFADHGKSMVLGETEGFVKLLADPAIGEILGGAVVGPHGSDLIHEIVVAMKFRATARDLAETPHYHPTLSEIWTYPAEKLMGSTGPGH